MCGICGIISIVGQNVSNIECKLNKMNDIQRHRGPDGNGTFVSTQHNCGLGHVRLSIIDVAHGKQPMSDAFGNTITFNGEIYNHQELRSQLNKDYQFKTNHSDTETILAAYQKWGTDCVHHLDGMFSFAIWNEKENSLFIARDFAGIKPLNYFVQNGIIYFTSETKALTPFIDKVEIDNDALADYLNLQLYLDDKTLFKNILTLDPGSMLLVKNGKMVVKKYYEVQYDIDHSITEQDAKEEIKRLMKKSVQHHVVSDVPIAAYASGGIDSSIVDILAKEHRSELILFHGKFSQFKNCDESQYAKSVANGINVPLLERDISANDFLDNIHNVVYHLDYPVAGPGSFSQYIISQHVANNGRKVVLGGQGGDEIFGGYNRYLIGFLDYYLTSFINGDNNKNLSQIDHEAFMQNLRLLKQYKPLMKNLFSDGMFESFDRRYFSLINRFDGDNIFSKDMNKSLHSSNTFDRFAAVFNGDNVSRDDPFNQMLNFDFKVLLPALLQVEDRVSMAAGLESRVPFIQKDIVNFAAKIPIHIKMQNGNLKHILTDSFSDVLPQEIVNRKDKMGFPTPINAWMKNEAKDFIYDIFNSRASRERGIFDNDKILNTISKSSSFSRQLWGALSIEMWCGVNCR